MEAGDGGWLGNGITQFLGGWSGDFFEIQVDGLWVAKEILIEEMIF
jgi:hypothetical protein